jgi:resuscitation-promoting factor RpfA
MPLTGRAITGPNPTADLAGVGKGHSLRQARLRPRIRRSLTLGAATFALAGVAAACTPAAALPSPSAGDLYRLRMCESGGNYAINTGNGYYGAYQFAVGTWNSLGFPGYPNQAAPATQDAAVAKLWRSSGWASWPGCAASLGL